MCCDILRSIARFPVLMCWVAALFSCCLRGQTELVTNGDFEALPFGTGWTTSAVVAVPGLNGSATAARLPYNTMAMARQNVATAAQAFTLEVSFSLAGNTTPQGFVMALDTESGSALSVRTAAGGELQVRSGDVWLTPTRVADGGVFNLAPNQTLRLRIIGRGFGTASASYDLVWSEPGQTSFSHAVTGLRHFASVANAVAGGVRGLRFDRAVAADNSFLIDDVSLRAATESAPEADYQIIQPAPEKVVNISGVYPHLAMTNTHDECGVGAVVSWAGKLWVITYGPHVPRGGSDKLYEIAPDLSRVIRPESIGGTPANRFIHAASQQLIIGPYFIRPDGTVRSLSYSSAPGRYTATAAHLFDPVNRIYMFTMEDGLYDVNVHDLSFITRYPDVQGTGDNFLAGYHGKGAYSSQGVLAVGNNGEPNQTMPSGVLATWDGSVLESGRMTVWTQVERVQTCEVTGPGGIFGNPNPATDPLWTTGFDAKSVVLHTYEAGVWHTWRLPKASYTHDGAHGWHTEWPRIRQLDAGDPASPYLMHMHGLFYDFPKTFSAANFSGLRPISSHYKMPVDYCMFEGRLVMGKNDTSRFSNALVPKAESNLWFGQLSDLEAWGAPTGHGAVWMNNAVAAGELSDPFLVFGFPRGTLHLRNLGASPVEIELQSSQGSPRWTTLRSITVPGGGYVYTLLNNLSVPWLRLKAGTASTSLTAFFHLHSPYPHRATSATGAAEFAALVDIDDARPHSDGLIRVTNTADLRLEFASARADGADVTTLHRYHQVGGDLVLKDVVNAAAETTLRTAAATTRDFGSDAASAWVTEGSNRFRLPRLDPRYDQPFAAGWARGFREVVTERQLLNCHGTFYEVPRGVSGGYRKMRPLVTHGKRITDMASWRGLLVLTGVRDDAPASDKLIRNVDGTAALWLGEVDDLWRMGEPRGVGGPWLDTPVTAGGSSDPYLMYGYDHKSLELAHGATTPVVFTVEVDFLGDNSWVPYRTFHVPAGQSIVHRFPDGFHAHWVRLKADTTTAVTAQFTYGPVTAADEFQAWAAAQGLDLGGDWDELARADPDEDGLGNLAEYFLGGRPLDAASRPGLSVAWQEGPSHSAGAALVFSFPYRVSAAGLGVVLQSSETLEPGSWTDRPELVPTFVPDGSGDDGTATVTLSVGAGERGKLFVRLRIFALEP